MSEVLFMTRTDFMFKYRIPYATIADRVRKKEIELHLIDGKIQVNVQEALKACQSKRPQRKDIARDLFTRALGSTRC
jgi:hypothetical protein